MEKHFTHLHLHTDYSLLDGAISIDRLVSYGTQHALKALAITDHGNIFGAVKFFQACKKAKIKPILGMEAYITEDVSLKSIHNKYYHLIILVENEIGYKNLCKLISFSFKEGFYFKNRIDYNILEKHSEGLIVTSACLGGHIPKLLMEGTQQEVDHRVDWFLNVFGRDRFYLEVQPEDQPDQSILNKKLYALAEEKNIKLVAAGDCHYPTLEDHEAHEIMLSIQTHGKITDPDRYTFGACRTYMRSPHEMLEIFKDHQDAVWNSGVIADRCNFEFETNKLHFPQFKIPQEHTEKSFFSYLCQNGFDALVAKNRIPEELKQEYQDRLNLEIDLISNMGYIGYFLVVGDFIAWAKDNAIPVGPGRGSAAGSLVAWVLQITNIDPLKYNLLFERFLNPERVSMPDIDIDFCVEGRERVINYVREKYGHDNVCQIITFGTMMAKGVLKDAARVLNIPFEDANMLTALIPNQLNITLTEALTQEPRLQEMIDNNPRVKHLFDIAFRLEGLTRHASKHAAGIVISPERVDDVLPIYIPAKTNDLVTQYAMTELETLGFLKMDFLGLKTLTLIDLVVKMIHKNHNVLIDIDMLPIDDLKTFALLCAGNTSGIFQLESSGLKEVLRKLQPDKFEDIIAVNALYRPGPLGSGMVDDYIERRHGRQKVTYLLPQLADVLEETYGVIVYQEQVMKIASLVAGYSLGEADILRRAMGKKKADVMAEQKKIFSDKSVALQVNQKKAEELFDLMAYFAGYGFNKSHSAAYALIAYQTAFLKAHYPAEFMAVLISLESSNAEKMAFYLEEAKSMGLEILPPDINCSEITFHVPESGKIRFGLQGIKNIGPTAVEDIIHQRTKKKFVSLLDFCLRVDLRLSNKRVIEHLIFAGAFDLVPGNRAQKNTELEIIIEQALSKKRELETGQMGLFGLSVTQDEALEYAFQPLEDWPDKEKLDKEKEVMGFYVSAHPLDSYKKHLHRLSLTSFEKALLRMKEQNSLQDVSVMIPGMIKSKRIITTKKGDKMAFVQCEDYTSSGEIVLFPSTFKKVEHWLSEYTIFIIKGTVDQTNTSICKILASEMVPLELFFQEWKTFQGAICIFSEKNEYQIDVIKKTFSSGSVPLIVEFYENGKRLQLKTTKKIKIDAIMIQKLEEHNVSVKFIT